MPLQPQHTVNHTACFWYADSIITANGQLMIRKLHTVTTQPLIIYYLFCSHEKQPCPFTLIDWHTLALRIIEPTVTSRAVAISDIRGKGTATKQ